MSSHDESTLHTLFARRALLPTGWARDVSVGIDAFGNIARVDSAAPDAGAERVRGALIPGIPDLHCHAFQRAMAGRAERRGPAGCADSFWTWRQSMYELAAELRPESCGAIAAQLYVELLCAGFTSVCEFHYLHHQPDGRPYRDVGEMSLRVVDAAQRAGIRLTHLPVLYARGGFDDRPLAEAQKRFRTDPDQLGSIRAAVDQHAEEDPTVRTGLALHSLRAVDPAMLRAAVATTTAADRRTPIHIHVAEQPAEVDDCLAATGLRPVQWLLEHAPVDQHWCLVHATHVDKGEVAAMARSGATAGLCPTTEANLGDGVFPLGAWLGADGAFGIGSDSNVSRSAAEELRWLEYGQRLHEGTRNHAARAPNASVGAALVRGALAGGAAASGQPIGAIAPGLAADLVVLDEHHLDALAAVDDPGDALLDAWVFAAGDAMVRDVMVQGRWVVTARRHRAGEEIERDYRAVLRS